MKIPYPVCLLIVTHTKTNTKKNKTKQKNSEYDNVHSKVYSASYVVAGISSSERRYKTNEAKTTQ